MSITHVTSRVNYSTTEIELEILATSSKQNQTSGHFPSLFVYPTLTFFLDFYWLVAAIMDFSNNWVSATYDV
jgi:hypothetical protein